MKVRYFLAVFSALLLASCAKTGDTGVSSDSTESKETRIYSVRATDDEVDIVLEPIGGTWSADSILWRVNGARQYEGENPKGSVANGRAVFPLTPFFGEQVVTVSNGEPAGDDVYMHRVYSVELMPDAIQVDGKIGEDWVDPATIRIQAPRQTVSGDLGDASATVNAIFTQSYFQTGIVMEGLPDDEAIEVVLAIGPTRYKDRWTFVKLEIPVDRDSVTITPDTYIPNEGEYFLTRDSDSGKAAVAVNEGKVTVEASFIMQGFLASGPLPGDTTPFNVSIKTDSGTLAWSGPFEIEPQDDPDWGTLVVLPDPATLDRKPRQQLHGGDTEIKVSETATKDPAYLTPIPVEYPEYATHLPEGITFRLPYNGSYEIGTGYGFESESWTHQTISNLSSANDFYALDIDVPVGTPIVAPAAGRIVTSNRRADSYGNYIVIDHGMGIHTVYAHLDSLEYQVDKGQPEIYVEPGDQIGMSGSTGTRWPHLHFAVHRYSRVSHSGADVAGVAVCPEPLGGYYGIREGHVLSSE